LKKTRILWTLIAFAVISSAQPVMTNQTVEAMLRGGVAVPTILTAIKTAAYIQLFISKEFYDRLRSAGASSSVADQIVQAMNDRTYNGAERFEDVKPVPVAAALASPRVVPTAVAQPVETPVPVVTLPPPPVVPAPALIAPVRHTQTADAHAAFLKTISDLIPKIDAEIKKVTTQWEDTHSEQLALARSSEAIVKAPYNADNRDELRGMLKKESTLIEMMKSLTGEIHRLENLRKLASMVPACQATFLSTVDKKTSD